MGMRDLEAPPKKWVKKKGGNWSFWVSGVSWLVKCCKLLL